MPIYEYECRHCHHTFDAMQKMSEAPLTECPECKNQSVVRLVSAAGFQLKGSGWYVTDFKNKSNPKTPDNTSDSGTSSTPKSTDSSKSQSSGESS